MADYIHQLNRVRRILGRLENIERSTDDYDDDMWSFFQNCWHLKDWIKNDKTLPKSFCDSIEGIVTNVPDLKVCADLANRTKHLNLINPRVNAKHSGRSIAFTGGKYFPDSFDYFIDSDNGNRRNALELARQCVKEWEQILTAYGYDIN